MTVDYMSTIKTSPNNASVSSIPCPLVPPGWCPWKDRKCSTWDAKTRCSWRPEQSKRSQMQVYAIVTIVLEAQYEQGQGRSGCLHFRHNTWPAAAYLLVTVSAASYWFQRRNPCHTKLNDVQWAEPEIAKIHRKAGIWKWSVAPRHATMVNAPSAMNKRQLNS